MGKTMPRPLRYQGRLNRRGRRARVRFTVTRRNPDGSWAGVYFSRAPGPRIEMTVSAPSRGTGPMSVEVESLMAGRTGLYLSLADVEARFPRDSEEWKSAEAMFRGGARGVTIGTSR